VWVQSEDEDAGAMFNEQLFLERLEDFMKSMRK
jgi:hypothetical protein